MGTFTHPTRETAMTDTNTDINTDDTGADTATSDVEKLRADLEKWKAQARKHEQRAKDNADKAKAYDELTESQKSEVDKALARAEKAEAELAEMSTRTLRAEVAAAKGLTEAQASRLRGATREELESDAEALLEAFPAAPVGSSLPALGGPGRSDIGGDRPDQLDRTALQSMTPEQINEARLAGRFDDLLGITKKQE